MSSLPTGSHFASWPRTWPKSEEKVQRCLELAGERYGGDLLLAVALSMGKALVDVTLPHLRTATGSRVQLLQKVLYASDPNWVLRPEAKRIIQKQLKRADLARMDMMKWLADSGSLGEFLSELHECPPETFQEWGALGRANVWDEDLFDHALALLPQAPATLSYLLRLDPVREAVAPRMLACARGEWVVAALETAILDGLKGSELVSIAEIAVRLGGVAMATAYAWIANAHLSPAMLNMLVVAMRRDGNKVAEALWVRRTTHSGDRALADGRQGRVPDAMDAAALVREIHGEKALELVREIVTQPRDALMEPVLRPLCATNPQAAREVLLLSASPESDVAKRAKIACDWPDVLWPRS